VCLCLRVCLGLGLRACVWVAAGAMGNVASGATQLPVSGTPEQYVAELTTLAAGRYEVKGNTRCVCGRARVRPQERRGK
jgi:hypothetical protein